MEQLLMPQLRESGLDATNVYFSTIYDTLGFMSMRFDADAFGQSPVTPWRYCAWLHLMELLTDSALSFNQESRLFVINFRLEDPVRIGHDAPSLVDCELQFSLNDGQIHITSCAPKSVDHASGVRPQLDVELFGRPSVCLTDEHTTVQFSLQVHDMLVPRIGASDDAAASSDDDSEPLLKRSASSADYSVPSVKRSASSASCQPHPGFPDYQWMKPKIVSRDVLKSICDSMRRRYGKVPGDLNELSVGSYANCDKDLTPRHFGCDTVIVQSAETRQKCISVISAGSAFSFDTESAQPKHSHEPISLVQIGTTVQVFVIHLSVDSGNDKVFLDALGEALRGKHLVHFDGDDRQQLCSVMECACTSFQNIQKSMASSTKGKPPGLKECIERMMHHRYALSKVWTLSGWDSFPLNQDQVNYATLDVVCTHALYLNSLSQPVFQFEKSNGCHTFLLPSLQSSPIRHGFCDTSDFLGHMQFGQVIQGFNIYSKSVVPAGFNAGSVCYVDHEPLNCFRKLLETKRFCCSMCSLSQTWRRWSPRFIFSDMQYDHRSFGYTRNSDVKGLYKSQKVFFAVHHDVKIRDALYCMSMLGALFNLDFNKDHDLATVCFSVHQDCRNGYISKTLAHLKI
jgi:hypothetical protein